MPTIGVGVFIIRRYELGTSAPIPPKILIGHRSLTNKRAPGVWALPGGMREPHETLQQCAEREVLEETGLRVVCNSNSEFQTHMFGISDHYPREDHLTAWAIAHQIGWDEPKIMEPEKCDSWARHGRTNVESHGDALEVQPGSGQQQDGFNRQVRGKGQRATRHAFSIAQGHGRSRLQCR